MDEEDPKPYRTDRTKPKTEFDKHPPSPTCSGTFNRNISLYRLPTITFTLLTAVSGEQ
jgi:hypothetical protein